MDYVTLDKLIEKMNLVNLTPKIDVNEIKITRYDINRPALPLAGFFDLFDNKRIQIIGLVEHEYIHQNPEEGIVMFKKMIDIGVPAIILCRSLEIPDEVVRYSEEKGIPVLKTDAETSAFKSEIIRWLRVELAPTVLVHGVLVDVFGEGVLIMGESGIGKSEVALELIHRGHRLVSDDVVEIRKVSDDTLIGLAPGITKHFIEVRGIGIIDAKALFGAAAVKNTQVIDLVIKLHEWNRDSEPNRDRLGLEEQYTEFMGNKVVCHSIPIRPGRNIAIVCESAAANHRQKKMGYNAAQVLLDRSMGSTTQV